MAHLTGRTLFFTTSPRSPEKMVSEIRLLVDNFSGRKWNKATQTEYAMALSATEFFEGSLPKDPSFISFYGGIPKAVPLALPYFRKMLANARQASYTPTKEQILRFFEEAHQLALTTHDENEWIGRVNAMAVNWTL